MHFMYLLLSILFISAILSMKCFITLITAVGVLKFELPFQFSVFWYFLAFSQPIKTSLCNSSQKFTLFGVDLWSLLFLLYNDIVTNISSEIRLFAVSEIHLFADDCIVYRTVTDRARSVIEGMIHLTFMELQTGGNDCMALQADIDILLNWSNTWQMKFNPSKCHILSIGHQRNKAVPYYPYTFLVPVYLQTLTHIRISVLLFPHTSVGRNT